MSQSGPWNNCSFCIPYLVSEDNSPLKGGNKVSEKGATKMLITFTARYLKQNI